MRTNAAVDGVLLVDKPAGMTSHDVVGIARRCFSTRRIGHTGTLDPFATGLLVLLLGRATRLAPYVPDEPKVYEASIAFGKETTTDDTTGDPTRERNPPSLTEIEVTLAALTGTIWQRPPDYSAKQVGGKRAYTAARAGLPLSLPPVEVHVHRWEIHSYREGSLNVTITCAGGTYIRALARDLGRATQSAAHLSALRRTAAGEFRVGDAHALEALRAGSARPSPIRAAIPHLVAQPLDADELRHAQHGGDVAARVDGDIVALLDLEREVVALAKRQGARLHPRVVLRDA